MENTMEKYRFNKEKHLHELMVDGVWKKLTGCTTVLGILAKPALIQWAADMTAGKFGWTKAYEWEEVDGKLKKVETPVAERLQAVVEPLNALKEMNQEDFLKFLDDARVAHAKKKEKAGDYGTKTHDTVSEIIKDAIANSEGFIRSGKNPSKSVQNFIDWAIANKVKFLDTERNIYSEFLFIGGIVDMVFEINGEVWIGDIKTSGSGIYPEHFWQCAGYNLMLEEMGLYPNVKGYLILNLKETGEFLEKRSISNEENRQIFRNCLDIYRAQEKLKNSIN